MSWSQTSTREWRAPLDSHEQLHAAIPTSTFPLGREHWSITAIVKLRFEGWPGVKDGETALRQAWLSLRFEQPAIAARLDNTSGEKVYSPPEAGTTDLQEWMDETFVVTDGNTKALHTRTHNPMARTADELFANFKPHELPTLYFPPDTSELVYHTSHWRTDGYGVLMLLGRLLDLSCSPTDPSTLPWGEEVSRLHPSVETLLGVPMTVSQSAQDLVNERISRFVSSLPSTGIGYLGEHDSLPKGSRQISKTFSSVSTQNFVTTCKAAGVTVSIAVNAASVRATFLHEANHAVETAYYASAVPTDLRHLLPPPYNGSAYASIFGMTGHSIIVPRGLSYMETAQALKLQYRNDMATSAFLPATRAWAKAFQGLVTTAPPANWPHASEIGNSSLGTIERHLPSKFTSEDGERAVTVTAFRLGVEMMTRQPELHVWSWKGQLTLSIVFNEAYHDLCGIDRLLKTIHKELEQGLTVVLDICD